MELLGDEVDLEGVSENGSDVGNLMNRQQEVSQIFQLAVVQVIVVRHYGDAVVWLESVRVGRIVN